MATKLPCPIPYWHETEEILDLKKIEQYSQMKNYRPGDVTKFLGRTYICDIANGIDFNDIRIRKLMPGKWLIHTSGTPFHTMNGKL